VPKRQVKLKAPKEPPRDPSVAEAVRRDLKELAKRDSKLAKSAQAATALSLAKELDSSRNSATSKSMCAKALNDTMAELRELAPDEKKDDGVDELAERRRKRRKGGSAAKD
jgi:5'-deoxynucleotidase YfbR-like HD superfamily hydrolase